MVTRSKAQIQNPELEGSNNDTVKKSASNISHQPNDTQFKPRNIQQEVDIKEEREAYQEKGFEDYCPRHLRFKEEDLKLIRKWKMCKYYGHHLICQQEKKNGKCDYLHDHLIRGAYDLVELNKKDGIEIPIEEIRPKLIPNFDEQIHDHRTLANAKCETLLNYPMKPSYRERKKVDYFAFQIEQAKKLENLARKQEERKMETEQEDDKTL